MLDELTAEELTEWEVYSKMQPIGTWRQDFRFAMIASTIVNIAKSIWGKRGEKKNLKNPQDFIPKWDSGEEDKEVPQESFESMRNKFQLLAARSEWKESRERKLASERGKDQKENQQ